MYHKRKNHCHLYRFIVNMDKRTTSKRASITWDTQNLGQLDDGELELWSVGEMTTPDNPVPQAEMIGNPSLLEQTIAVPAPVQG